MKKLSKLTAVIGSLLMVLAFSGTASAEANPFAEAEQIQTFDGHKDGKCGEGKCGDKKKDKKCGEGKCGDKKDKKCGEGKCGDKKGKCGEGKCGDKKGKKEGKCGEGKCGR